MAQLTEADLYRQAAAQHERGNKLHLQGHHEDAIECFHCARDNLAGYESEQIRFLRRCCWLNESLCHLTVGRTSTAIDLCTQVLKVDSKDAEAYYRRGLAFASAGDLKLSEADLLAALKITPDFDAAKQTLARVQAFLKSQPPPQRQPQYHQAQPQQQQPATQNRLSDVITPEDISQELYQSCRDPAEYRRRHAAVLRMTDQELQKVTNRPAELRKRAQLVQTMTDNEITALLSSVSPSEMSVLASTALGKPGAAAAGGKPLGRTPSALRRITRSQLGQALLAKTASSSQASPQGIKASFELLPRSKWQDDDSTEECMLCPTKFTMVTRRHHCRACGLVVCRTCAPSQNGLRICTSCRSKFEGQVQQQQQTKLQPKQTFPSQAQPQQHDCVDEEDELYYEDSFDEDDDYDVDDERDLYDAHEYENPGAGGGVRPIQRTETGLYDNVAQDKHLPGPEEAVYQNTGRLRMQNLALAEGARAVGNGYVADAANGSVELERMALQYAALKQELAAQAALLKKRDEEYAALKAKLDKQTSDFEELLICLAKSHQSKERSSERIERYREQLAAAGVEVSDYESSDEEEEEDDDEDDEEEEDE